MPETAVSTDHGLVRWGRWALVGGLIGLLLVLGVYDEPIHAVLTSAWLKGLAAVGLREKVAALQQGISGSIVKRLLPAVATYAACYLAVCLLLLRLLLPAPAQWRVVLQLYAGILAIYVVLVLVGKLAGDAAWAFRLSRHLLDFVVSPLPVAALYVLMKTGFGPAPRP